MIFWSVRDARSLESGTAARFHLLVFVRTFLAAQIVEETDFVEEKIWGEGERYESACKHEQKPDREWDGRTGAMGHSQTRRIMTVTPKLNSQTLMIVIISIQPLYGAGPEIQPKSGNRDALPIVSQGIRCQRQNDSQNVDTEYSQDKLYGREDIWCASFLCQPGHDYTEEGDHQQACHTTK